MTTGTIRFSVLTALVLAAALPLAAASAPVAPAASPTTPAVSAVAPAAPVAATCPAASTLTSILGSLPLADDICGLCSDAVCVGQEWHSECGPGLRCIPQELCASGAAAQKHCRCLII